MNTTTSPSPVKIRNIGAAIDDLFALREQKRELAEQIKEITEKAKALEVALMTRMDKEGTRKSEGSKAGVSITSTVVGNLVDDVKFFTYVKKTGYFHLLQPRLSDSACRELFESKGSIPGVEPFTVRRLNLRTL